MRKFQLRFLVPLLIISVIGIGLWTWSWYLPLYKRVYSVKPAFLGPAMTILGIGSILVHDESDPEYRRYLQQLEHDQKTGERRSLDHLPQKLKKLMLASLVGGVLHAAFIYRLFGM